MALSITLVDARPENYGKRYQLENVGNLMPIIELRHSVAAELNIDKNEDILLVFAKKLMTDDKTIADYNRSKRSKIQIEVSLRKQCHLRIKTIQGLRIGSCYCYPSWAFLCRQTIHLNVCVHETVLDLKKAIVNEIGEDRKVNLQNMRLEYYVHTLKDDSAVLSDYGIENNSSISMIVPLFWCVKNVNSNKKISERNANNDVCQPLNNNMENDTDKKNDKETNDITCTNNNNENLAEHEIDRKDIEHMKASISRVSKKDTFTEEILMQNKETMRQNESKTEMNEVNTDDVSSNLKTADKMTLNCQSKIEGNESCVQDDTGNGTNNNVMCANES